MIGRAETKVPLIVKARTSVRGGLHREREVYLCPSRYTPGELVVVVEGTPGRWNLSDFMEGSGALAIDFGQGWVLDNADEIRAVLRLVHLETTP